MEATVAESVLVLAARELAQVALAELPERWRHSVGVARRAEELAVTVDRDDDRDVLLAAAWLHDIGYAPAAHDTGFHPLDGARHLQRLGWPWRVSALVAHHSDAASVARVRGLHAELARFPFEVSAVADALTYADQTVGPAGVRMSLDERQADMLHRHGSRSPNATAHEYRAPRLAAVAARVEARLSRCRPPRAVAGAR